MSEHYDLMKNYFNNAIKYFDALNVRHANVLRSLRCNLVIAPLGLRAGTAQRKDGINIVTLDQFHLNNHRDEALYDTLPHEVAHIVAMNCFGDNTMPHGNEWRMSCVAVGHRDGYNAKVYHDKDMQPLRKTRKFKYRCSCNMEHLVGLNVHKKILSNNTARVCNRCGTRISFVSEV